MARKKDAAPKMVQEPTMMERAQSMAEELMASHVRNSASFKKVSKQMAQRMDEMMRSMGRKMTGRKGMM